MAKAPKRRLLNGTRRFGCGGACSNGSLGRLLSAGDQFAGYDYAYDRLGRMIRSEASIAGLVPDHVGSPASEMPDHMNILPVAEKRVYFTCDSTSQPSTLSRYVGMLATGCLRLNRRSSLEMIAIPLRSVVV